MKRLAKSEEFRQVVEDMLISGKTESLSHPLEAFIKMSARYMLQVALEREITEYLDREHYRRGNRIKSGYRNGYEPRNLKSPNGILQVAIPQLRDTEDKFRSELLNRLKGGSDVLNRLVTELYVRGLSCADVENTFCEIFGRKIISRSGVSEITKQLVCDFNTWCKRDLSSHNIVYFLDATYLALRQGTDEKEGVLCAYGITAEGKKLLLHLALGERESYDAWLGFLHEMAERGLNEPLLVINDGNSGHRKAIREVFPRSLRQRCQVHKMRNIVSKLPKDAIGILKPLIQNIFQANSYEDGLKKGRALIERFRGRFPSAISALEKDLEECLTCLKFPSVHRRSIRTTNLLERVYGEVKRRTKVIPRFPTEKSGLKLMFAVLIRESSRWHGLGIPPTVMKELADIREQIFYDGAVSKEKELVTA
jgi:transposase-like protein